MDFSCNFKQSFFSIVFKQYFQFVFFCFFGYDADNTKLGIVSSANLQPTQILSVCLFVCCLIFQSLTLRDPDLTLTMIFDRGDNRYRTEDNKNGPTLFGNTK